jgi:hypothetical protein
MGEQHDHGPRMMHPRQCRMFDDVLSICCRSGAVSQALYSDAIRSQQDSIRGLAWIKDEAILEASPCVRILGFCLRSERETKKLDYSATPGLFVGYSISTKQFIVYDPLAETLHPFRDVVFRDRTG